MKCSYSDIEKKDIWIYGCGNLLNRYFPQMDSNLRINGIIDVNPQKWGDIAIAGRSLVCKSIEEADNLDGIILAIESPHVINQVSHLLDLKGISWCHIFEAVDAYSRKIYTNPPKRDTEEIKICKFIDTTVPTFLCNFNCEYCYLSQKKVYLDNERFVFHDANYIRRCLSVERLGGIAFINLCGVGETLLCRELYDIVGELVREGHFIQIVTNATVTKEIERYASGEIDTDHLFFKCSFHYRQLKQRGLLDVFTSNVRRLYNAGISITVEITPEDELIPYIEEIKEFSLKEFGALPHITVARNEGAAGFNLYSSYSLQKFYEIWSTFDSAMLDFKISQMDNKRGCDCMAGKWSAELNLATGEYLKCVGGEYLCNIYEDPTVKIAEEKVGGCCRAPYCFNNHAYLTFGLIPSIKTPTYYDMRNRTRLDGSDWIYEKMKKVFEQKLGD